MRLLGVGIPLGLVREAVDIVDALLIRALERGRERGGLGIVASLELVDGSQRAVMEVHVPVEPLDEPGGPIGVRLPQLLGGIDLMLQTSSLETLAVILERSGLFHLR